MDDATLSLLVLGAAVVLFVWNRLPVGVVAVGVALSLAATGVLSAEQAISGFGDPVVVFLASLFVVSEALDATGVTTWVGQALVARAGLHRVRLTATVLLLAAVLTALITLNGAVAALLPMVVVIAARLGEAPSRLLMPLAFAGSAGSLLALTGSPVNIIVSDAAVDAGADGFAFFDFAVVGVPLVLGTVLLSVVLGPRVLPAREPHGAPPDLSEHAGTLEHHYGLEDGFYRLRVRERSPLAGRAPAEVDLAPYPDVTVIGVQSADGRRVAVPATAPGSVTAPASGRWTAPEGPLRAGDVLVVSGAREQISRLVVDQVLTVGMAPVTSGGPLIGREIGVVEVVVPPRSTLVGETVFRGMAPGPDLVVLAVRRRGSDVGRDAVELAEGDVLLLHGTWPALEALVEDRDVLVVDAPDLVRRQSGALSGKAQLAVAVSLVMIVLLATGAVAPAVATLAAATALVALRVLTAQQAYRAVSWQTVVLVGGLIPLSTAIQQSGAADRVADVIVEAVGTGSPYALLVVLFLLTAALGQVVSNTATVLVVVPIAVAAAAETGVSVLPVLMLVAVAGAASLLTPIATPANLMVMGPGGYRFGDYWRLGLPVMLLWLAIALLVIPLVWPFSS